MFSSWIKNEKNFFNLSDYCCQGFFASSQGTRDVLRKHVDEFGDLIRKDNDVALIIDGQVSNMQKLIEVPHGKMCLWACAQVTTLKAYMSVQSHKSLLFFVLWIAIELSYRSLIKQFGWAGRSELSLIAYALWYIFSWCGSIILFWTYAYNRDRILCQVR